MTFAFAALACHAGLPPATYNLGAIPSGVGATINGPGLAAHGGTALAGGCDLNGDGIADLVIGAPGAGVSGQGMLYVIYGNASGTPPPASVNTADVTIVGEGSGDGIGASIACGDVNGDGNDDLLLATTSHTSAGYAYLVYGGATLPATLNLVTLTANQGMRIPGLVNGTQFDGTVAMGDVNGDGRADIVVTAPRAHSSSSNTGQVFVIFGSASFGATFDLGTLSGSNGFSISATDLGLEAGNAVAVGDLTGDGRAEIAVGAPQAFPNGHNDAGSVFVVFGHAAPFPAQIQVGQLTGSDGFTIDAAQAGGFAGSSLAFVTNFTGNGHVDLAVGAPAGVSGSALTGRAYVVFGATTFPSHLDLSTLNGSNGVTLASAVTGDYAGATLAGMPDINGDARGEILLGAPKADVGATDAGGGFLVYGHPAPWPASVDLSTLNGATGFRIDGALAGDVAGTAIATGGDQNRDGLHDVMIAAPLADNASTVNVGKIYLLYGNDLIFADGFDGP